MTLVETLTALVLLGVGLLAVAPMFVHGMRDNTQSADFGLAGAIAVERMELLREEPYDSPLLAAGGSLTSNVTAAGVNYFDNSDPEVIVRWLIESNSTPTNTKIITTRATRTRQVVGQAKRVTLTSMRGGP